MRHLIGIAGVGIAVFAACGMEPEGPVPESSRFEGQWFLEETEAHALYGASIYDFQADGDVALVWDAGYYQIPLGHVRDAFTNKGISCVFADRWHSPDDDTLVIESSCSDSVAREIVLGFTSDPASNASGATVEIVSVGGESGWLPPVWGWSFRKCTAASPCEPVTLQ